MSTHSISIYDNAKHWIAQYESVDEVKDYIDKAAACQEYAKRANDYEMEHQAARARVRAEKRAGELLQETEKAQGKRTDLVQQRDQVNQRRTLSDMGITKNQSSKWQQLANVPEDEFEEAINLDGAMPSAHGILKSREQQPEKKRLDKDALYLWGTLLEVEKKMFHKDMHDLINEMTPAMRKDSLRVIPLLIEWIGANQCPSKES